MPNTNAPIAKIIPKKLRKHNQIRIDNYYWLNNRENPEVLNYLNQENAYYQEQTAHTKEFQNNLYEEMKSRIKEDDTSVPYFYNGYYYFTRMEKGKNYPLYTRRKEFIDAPEELLFDCNEMANGQAFFQLGSISVSPNNKLALFSFDIIGRRIYTLKIKNLETHLVSEDVIENTTGNAVWANDNETLFFSSQDLGTLRSDKIFKYKIGSNLNPELVYFEKDETFSVEIAKSKSRKYLAIEAASTLSSEYQILEADNPDGNFRVFQKRKRGVEYAISHYNDYFYIKSNCDGADNFKLLKTPENKTNKKFWKEVIPHRNDVLLEDVEIFKDFLVLEERSNGLNKIRIRSWDSEIDYYLPFESETYTAFTGTNVDFDTTILRYSYQSLATPSSIIDFNMKTHEKEIKKEQEVVGGTFIKSNYIEERIWAVAIDGTKIPISLVYHKKIQKKGTNPLLLYAYGSYGYSMDASFSSTRLSLLDRGFIFAIAHVRGGEDLGRNWYEGGKLLTKKNTFTDFVACSQFLIDEKYTSNKHLYAEGGSAGGLLMGVIANTNPELYNGIIAQVPFVDVVTTMLDDSIPLTTGEYDEWGNPNKKEYFEYMLSYSPYDNVTAQNYPNMYISTGLHDSQVQYWEPAKWVAKLRATKTDTKKLYFDINMDAGHGGASGRYEDLKELAKEFIFLFELEGIKK